MLRVDLRELARGGAVQTQGELKQDDPALEGVGCVIFDELHERGLESDLAFALVRESQGALREDLRVIAMSATLDPGPVSQRLGDRSGGAPLVESAGRMFPVEVLQ